MTLPVEINVADVKRLLQSLKDDIILLDCRTEHERKIAFIEPSLHIPLDQLETQVHQFDRVRSKRIVVYCHSGGRSLAATNWLRAKGIVNVQNMAGGIDAWSVEIDSKIPRYR